MIVSILSVVMMMVDHRQNHLESIRSFFSIFVYPVQLAVDAPNSAGHWVGDVLSSRETLLQENARLKQEQTLLKVQLQKLSSLMVENNRLRDLLQSSRKIGQNVLVGEILKVDLEPFTRQIVLNKGSKDDVFLGQPLLDADGIMGQIIHVGPFSSTAMMITDPNHAIPVHVNRNGQRAILFGTGKPDVMDVPYLANSADIVVGDLLISSGLGGRFPPDYPVAKVLKVERDPAKPYAVITAAPTAQLERSREVLLVWQTQKGAPKASAPLEISPQSLKQAEKEVREREQELMLLQLEQTQESDDSAEIKPSSTDPVSKPATEVKPVSSPKPAVVSKPVIVKPVVKKEIVKKPVDKEATTNEATVKVPADEKPQAELAPPTVSKPAATPVEPASGDSDSSSLMPIQEEFVSPSDVQGNDMERLDSDPDSGNSNTLDEGR